MKKALLPLVVILFCLPVKAQRTVLYTWIHYSGTIGTYPVEMKIRLTKNSDSIQGQYYYTRQGETASIDLDGAAGANETHIIESAYNRQLQQHEKTGSFALDAPGNKEWTGTWTSTRRQTLPVKLTRIENGSVNDLPKWDFRLQLYKGKVENAGGTLQTYTKANQLILYDPVKKRTLQLGGFDEVMYNDYGEAELEDLNFDGYPDLKIPIYFPQAIKNDGAWLYFIYNPQTRQFVLNKALNEMGYLDFNARTKEFRKSDADGRGNEGDTYYRWVGNTFYLVREVRVYEDSPQVFYTEYTIRNGRSVKTRSYKK